MKLLPLTAWFTLAVLLALAVPLHLCMPIWCDGQMFDVCARVLLRGQLFHREVFYFTPPGMIFAQAGIRSVLGWSSEALRLADLLLVCGSVALLVRFILPTSRWLGGQVWTACLLLFFYFSTTEFCHCQPDVWMMLPVFVAVTLRIRQLNRLRTANADLRGVAALALAEGVCWGIAVLFKPPIMIPAVACWLLTVIWIRIARPATTRVLIADFLGLLFGGLLVGGSILLWLVVSGNWPYFVRDGLSGTAGEYYRQSAGWDVRILKAFRFRWTWSIAHLVALPVALASIGWSFREAARKSAEVERPALAVALLSALYLGWFYQANFIQQQLLYHQVPPMILALAVLIGWARLANWGWIWKIALAGMVVWSAVLSPVLQPSRLALWPRCWTEGATPQLLDALTLETTVFAVPNNVELERVADYLREQAVGDRELVCFNLTTLPLYQSLGVTPGTRYIQVTTCLALLPSRRETILRELDDGPQRFIVWDTYYLTQYTERPEGPTLVPERVLQELHVLRNPIVFRAGRYVVARMERNATQE